MKISCSIKGIVEKNRPKQGLQDIAQAEFSNLFLDLSILAPGNQIEKFGKSEWKTGNDDSILENPKRLLASICEMHKFWKGIGIDCNVSRSPFLLWETKRSDLNELQKALTEQSIISCGKIGCKYIIVRSLFAGIEENKLWEVNREYYLSLAALAKKHDVKILLENQCKNYCGHLIRGICAEGAVAAEWVDRLNKEAQEERFGFCLNVGICNLCGQNMYDFTLSLGSRIKAVILCDGDGVRENAMLPFSSVGQGQSQTDWLNLIRGLRKIEFDGELVLDSSDSINAFSPILRPSFLQLAKATAEYFKWQIEIERVLKKYPQRVLFGAGNMCRNYMKCYGEKYPPLYTCDNNSNLWGSQFCGLEVKAPKYLKNLPSDCAIFICNIYYREIASQLQGMGIENPIEFFNDEYMPDFYFDRLENRGK